MPTICVTSLVQTSITAPCQWEGRTADDRPFYIRLRHGKLSVKIGKQGDDIPAAVTHGDVLLEQHRPSRDEPDDISYEQLRKLLAGIAELPDSCESTLS